MPECPDCDSRLVLVADYEGLCQRCDIVWPLA